MNISQAALRDARMRLEALSKAAPGVMSGFSALSKAAGGGSHFDPADRELVALAIAIAKGCDDCILYHVDAAHRHGASETALIQTIGIAVEMGGGPAAMYGARALAAYRDRDAS